MRIPFPALRPARHDDHEAIIREIASGSRAWGIPPYRQMIPLVAAELRRSRRYEHPLSVVVLAPERRSLPGGNGNGKGSLDAPLHAAHSAHATFFLLGSLLRDTMRGSDIVAYAAEQHLYAAFLPESDERGASRAVRRLDRMFHDRSAFGLRAGIAEFPKDAFLVEDLFDQAREAFESRRVSYDQPLEPLEASHA